MTNFPASVPTTLSCVWEAQPESMKPSFWSVDTTRCLKPRASEGPLGAHGDHTSGIDKKPGFGGLLQEGSALVSLVSLARTYVKTNRTHSKSSGAVGGPVRGPWMA